MNEITKFIGAYQNDQDEKWNGINNEQYEKFWWIVPLRVWKSVS
jgi:hypothetical protein